MKVLVKNKKQFNNHIKIMESKVSGVPHKTSKDEPAEYPCVVLSVVSTGVNGYIINHEFVYKSDF